MISKILNQRKIVIVEDDIIMPVLIENVLEAEKLNYELIRASTASYALQMIEEGKDEICLIILDLKVRGKVTGIDFLKQIQEISEISRIPIMIFSGEDSLIQEAKKYHPKKIYRKPFHYQSFCAALLEVGLEPEDV